MDSENSETRVANQPAGEEGTGAQQDGKDSVQAGHTQGREHSKPEKNRPKAAHDHQKTVSGKKQHGPDDKVGRDGGGNEGSKGQNVDSRRSAGTGKEPGDVGDYRGRSRAKQ